MFCCQENESLESVVAVISNKYRQIYVQSRYLTVVILFDPDPRISRQADPERVRCRDADEVVDERLGGAGDGQGGVQRCQHAADGVTETVCLKPGGKARRPGVT